MIADDVTTAALELRVERELQSPPERVFEAFTDADQIRRWWGPLGFAVPELRFSPSEGGAYRIAMQPPEGDVFHLGGRFRVVDPPRRLAFTFAWQEPDQDDRETYVSVTFDPTVRGTLLTVDQGRFKTPARRELHHDGWTQTLERLASFLMSQTVARPT